MENYNKNLSVKLTTIKLIELNKTEQLMISGGSQEISIVSHMLRAMSGSIFGVAYWIGYGVSKAINE
ncbi:hypothetical protein IM793_07460 [Pedobacter sp. MR2016-19]|uniref:hypothetical protein n=1 Tax=unclassified Pedobacter TaxID=2628915 RepID=UPI001876E769|nr:MULTISPECIES: hypothetical protein [unclassified Pedobacter]MBE5318987.1 hypothetical protein [Pedobacter sp. MR2016-19]QXU40494.1 hypothetical protein KYH19_15975 [Pedobacter sp. D749]